MAGLNVSLLDQSQHFIPTTWDRPSDCWPRWSNRRYGENRGAQEQERRTPPRNYEGPMYNDYKYGNDMGSASQYFGGGSGTEYYGGSAPQSFGGGSGKLAASTTAVLHPNLLVEEMAASTTAVLHPNPLVKEVATGTTAAANMV